tara:strand:+ start:600 stop:1892 length:1293 start_codon:yes stop_codon:yes gene_type:complete
LQYISTRNSTKTYPLEEALRLGLAPDGGLFVPEAFPRFGGVEGDDSFPDDYVAFAQKVFKPFFEGSVLAPSLAQICERTFTFDMPLNFLDDNENALLELYWGPTAAFKDVGARFLANCFAAWHAEQEQQQDLTVLVATSGDTGGAVASAFHHQPGIRVAVLFPQNGVAPRQRQQLTAFDGNVSAYAVDGVFDDCQKLVKAAFASEEMSKKYQLTSANSINIGRLLPQSIYYAHASLAYFKRTQKPARFIIPSGNVGNATAALWAKRMGFPIADIVMSNNANGVVTDTFNNLSFEPRPSIPTLANAMDVGNPSNMERLLHLVSGDIPKLMEDMSAFTVSDAEIRDRIQRVKAEQGLVVCPHTATAFEVLARENLAGSICVATAHPAKFPETVEPLIGEEVPIPPALQEILSKETRVSALSPQLEDLDRALS